MPPLASYILTSNLGVEMDPFYTNSSSSIGFYVTITNFVQCSEHKEYTDVPKVGFANLFLNEFVYEDTTHFPKLCPLIIQPSSYATPLNCIKSHGHLFYCLSN